MCTKFDIHLKLYCKIAPFLDIDDFMEYIFQLSYQISLRIYIRLNNLFWYRRDFICYNKQHYCHNSFSIDLFQGLTFDSIYIYHWNLEWKEDRISYLQEAIEVHFSMHPHILSELYCNVDCICNHLVLRECNTFLLVYYKFDKICR